MINQRGTAVWNGDIKGSGEITTQSGTVQVPYSVGTRFEGQKGSNPEELIGAAHAACYTMYLVSLLTREGYSPTQVRTESKVTLDPGNMSPKVVKIAVSTSVQIPNLSAEDFQRYAEDAKQNCPISQLLSAVPEMTLEAKLQ
ncbi:OsmC family peroxiredoxin [Hymenobacter latericus]|uniref:OsmC family peroxiredoxin n=1 Tax=Hymenobacter sp. YIM 151858-1 TaxID=2987688 RepID=UPI00222614E8|nr:OsmC family peroxiredoxin [Hymenobacter sp. YIM 151858-1]UYZ59203.1 OsmC family peroxiredoxin [Hymenobacter sp. YIM 151858-1]